MADDRSTTAPASRRGTHESHSATVGGIPMRSRKIRRTRDRASACSVGFSPSSSILCSVKLSIAFFGQFANGAEATGISARMGFTYAQCLAYWPPCSTQRCKVAISVAVSGLLNSVGGMRTDSSSLVMRAISSLALALPATIAACPDSRIFVATSESSSRSPACRFASSGPWQAKQWLEMIGLTSRLKSTF